MMVNLIQIQISKKFILSKLKNLRFKLNKQVLKKYVNIDCYQYQCFNVKF